MYRYDIKGEDFKIGQAKKIGQAIAVIVDKEWLGKRVVVIRDGKILRYYDEEWTRGMDIDPDMLKDRAMYMELTRIRGSSEESDEEKNFLVNLMKLSKTEDKLAEKGIYLLDEIEKKGVDIDDLKKKLFIKERKVKTEILNKIGEHKDEIIKKGMTIADILTKEEYTELVEGLTR